MKNNYYYLIFSTQCCRVILYSIFKWVFYIQLQSHHDGNVSDWLSVITLPFGANSQHLWQLRRPASMCKWHLAPALSVSIYIGLIFAFFASFVINVFMSLFGCNVQNPRNLTEWSCSRGKTQGIVYFLLLLIAKYDRAVLLATFQYNQKSYTVIPLL